MPRTVFKCLADAIPDKQRIITEAQAEAEKEKLERIGIAEVPKRKGVRH